MKSVVFILLVFISQWLCAQQPVLYRDTVYHPFYNRVQIIELKARKSAPDEKGFVAAPDFQQFSEPCPVYILRNENGKIIETYNSPVAKWKPSSFLSPEASAGRQQFHLKKARNTSMWTGNDDSGYNILYAVYEADPGSHKVGLMDSMGKLRLPVIFDNIRWIDSVFIAKKADQYFLYDHTFREILPRFDSIDYVSTYRNHLIVKMDGRYGLIHRSGEILIPMRYEALSDSRYMPGYYQFLLNGKWGFVTHDFKQYIEPFAPTPDLFRRDGYYMYKEKDLWVLIDARGTVLLKSPLEIHAVLSPKRFIVGKYTLEKGYERSVCDESGRILTDKICYDLYKINPETVLGGYEATMHDASGLRKSTQWVLLDADGHNKSDKVYSQLINIDDRWFKAYDEQNGLTVIDDRGGRVLDFAIDDIDRYSSHVFRITKDKKYTFIDLFNPEIKSEEYDNHQAVKGNRIAVMKADKWGFMDSSFRVIIPAVLESVEDYTDGITAVKMNGKWLVIDEYGYKLNDQEFDEVELLDGGYSKVKLGGKYGIMNRQGQLVVPVEYDGMPSLTKNGDDYLIVVKKQDKYGVVNLRHEFLYPLVFESHAEINGNSSIAQRRADGFYALLTITRRSTVERYYLNFDPAKNKEAIDPNYSNGFHKVSAAGKYGMANWDGELVIPCIYMNIGDYKNYTFRIYTESGGGLIDTAGKILIPPGYKYLYDMAPDYIRVGRHTGLWGLYTYGGKKIADTLYGGFEPPVFGLIPFYADLNYRFVPGEGWMNDEKKIGFMDPEGRIVLSPVYRSYQIPDRNKKEIVLVDDEYKVTIDGKGNILKKELLGQPVKQSPVVEGLQLLEKDQVLLKEKKAKGKKRKHKMRMP